MKYFFAVFFVTVLGLFLVLGPRGAKTTNSPIEIFPDMDHQPKFKAQTGSSFFADGRSNRLPVEGTVSFEEPKELGYLHTGKYDENHWGNGIPVTVNEALILRGKERYEINCQVCHGALGDGKGIIGQYGFAGIADLTDQRLIDISDGKIFNTITYGYGQMGPYSHIKVKDRWAIISYLRALQISQNASADSIPQSKREELN